MELTKYTHSCVRLEKAGRVLVVDPGNLSEPGELAEALDGAHHVLVTHVHPDHLDREPLLAHLRAHPGTAVHAPASVAAGLREELGEGFAVHDAEPETVLELDGFTVRTFGGQHALIHPQIRTVDNIGYLIDGTVYHPGDSLVVPHGLSVPVLLAPLHAPWNKMSEVIDFVVAVRPRQVHQIHDGLLSPAGFRIIEKQVSAFAAKYGVRYRHLGVGERVVL
ncbi:MBL fold metallo-hydrolase [Kocuria dechangensis]|uniref:MBL fold metallo-hydrolase n=1 Tax=Kocuria dechangensis TaxID=1176249 RepID=A0A917GW05_9MICC|nr:MBL fold metallo-hydrolase [Kocuria dechangensis]GGG57821.1 MBL fold metallo-hydrolase [Kocuria dechangensis]